MSPETFLPQLFATLESAIFFLPEVPGICSPRWSRWTERRIRRQLASVLTASCALRNALGDAEEALGDPLADMIQARQLLKSLLPGSLLPVAADYRRYAESWVRGLSADEARALGWFFGTTQAELPDHVTQWAFHPDDGGPLSP